MVGILLKFVIRKKNSFIIYWAKIIIISAHAEEKKENRKKRMPKIIVNPMKGKAMRFEIGEVIDNWLKLRIKIGIRPSWAAKVIEKISPDFKGQCLK